jgi:hypothetical protein
MVSVSAARADGGRALRQSRDATGRGGCPQAGDLVMLGGEPGERVFAEVDELVDLAGRLGETLLERGDFVLESSDLSIA